MSYSLSRISRVLPRLITGAVLDAFGKSEQTKKVFWALFIATAGLVLAQVVDSIAAQKMVEILAGLVP